MSPQDVIDSYVKAVAAQLPFRQRNDVARELRGQLTEELAAGATHDEQAALALVRRFGRPADVAARYHTPYTIIDPADTRSFVLAAIGGALLMPQHDARLPLSIDQTTQSLLYLAWIGALVIFFAARSWAIRRWPNSFQWSPSRPPRASVNVPAELAVALVFVLLETVYLAPGPVVAFLSGGRIDASRLVYTDSFTQPLRLWGFAAIMPILVVLHLRAAATRRWNRIAYMFSFLFLISAGTQLGWHARYGQIFADPTVDTAARTVFELVGAVMILVGLVQAYREWTRVKLPEMEAGYSV
jgi:hypothetical protein